MTVRAKFYVTQLDGPDGATAGRVDLSPVCRGVENALWAQATPCGTITMFVKNGPALDAFEKYAEYEVTFRKVEKPAAGDGHKIKPATTMHGQVVCEFCGQTLGQYTEEAIKNSPHLASYSTEETKASALEVHERVYGAQE